jgi:hypothetical protein
MCSIPNRTKRFFLSPQGPDRFWDPWNYASTCTRLHDVTQLCPRSTLRWAVKKFQEWWYCTAILGHGNAHLITFTVRPLRVHTLAPSILPLLEVPAEGFCWNLPGFGRRIPFYDLHGRETCPLEAHFQSREQPKVTGSEIRRVRWLGDDTTSDVWLGTETTVPACHLPRRFLCRTCTVTLCPGGTDSRRAKPSMSKISGNVLTAPPSSLLYIHSPTRLHGVQFNQLNTGTSWPLLLLLCNIYAVVYSHMTSNKYPHQIFSICGIMFQFLK